jgi:hypothetical protein
VAHVRRLGSVMAGDTREIASFGSATIAELAGLESLSVADSTTLQQGGGQTRSVSDSLTLADTPSRTATYARLRADSASVSDAAADSQGYSRSAVDSASVADTVTPQLTPAGQNFNRSVNDGVLVADNRALSFTRTFEITTGSNDGFAESTFPGTYPPVYLQHQMSQTTLDCSRTFNGTGYWANIPLLRFDTSSLPDNAQLTGASLLVQVTGGSNDNARNLVASWNSWNGTSADYSVASDALAGVALSTLVSAGIKTITLDNATGVSKTGNTHLKLAVSGGQPSGFNGLTIAALEHTTAQEPRLVVGYTLPTTHSRGPTDSLNVADSAVRQAAYARGVQDVATLADQTTPFETEGGLARSLAEALGVADAVVRTATYERLRADSANVSDAATRVASFIRARSDSAALTDSVSRGPYTPIVRTVSDAVSVVDTFTAEEIIQGDIYVPPDVRVVLLTRPEGYVVLLAVPDASVRLLGEPDATVSFTWAPAAEITIS